MACLGTWHAWEHGMHGDSGLDETLHFSDTVGAVAADSCSTSAERQSLSRGAAGQSDGAWQEPEAAQPPDDDAKQGMQALQLLVSTVVAAPRTPSLILRASAPLRVRQCQALSIPASFLHRPGPAPADVCTPFLQPVGIQKASKRRGRAQMC